MSSLIYPTTNLSATEQLTIERGDGIYVYDSSGKQYIEGMSGLWCTSLGYNNKELIEASNEQMAQLSYTHMFGGKTHKPGMELSEKLSELAPVKDAMVFFGNSGSDANDTHIKLLRYYFNAIGKPEKRKIITRERAYHGVTVASGCLTSLPVNLTNFSAPVEVLGILRTDHPHYYSGAQNGESEDEFVTRITNNLEKLILNEGAENIAAFIAEPVTGASGVIVPPPGYYEKVQEILNKHDILFWADEVITGFGRTGNDFGCTTMNIESPDLMSFAKQLSSAYFPISASVIRGDIYKEIAKASADVGVFGHGYTYSGHPVGCAIALKVMEIYKRDNIVDHAKKMGMYLQEKLNAFLDKPLVGEVRGKGLIAAIELNTDVNTVNKAAQLCQENGLIVRPVAGTSLALCPPLIISQSQIDEIISILKHSLESLAPA